jgi:hypothetical protein
MTGRNLILQNSVLVSFDALIGLDLPGAAGGGASTTETAAVRIGNCTLSAVRHVFSLGPSSADVARTPFYVERTAFAPPVELRNAGRPTAAIFGNTTGAALPRQIDWWGDANAFSAELRCFAPESETDAPPAAEKFAEVWSALWPPEHDRRLLSGDGDLMLAERPKDRNGLTARDFALHASSKAYQWSPDGSPIGADVDGLPGLERRTTSDRAKARKPGKQPERKNSGSPDF